MGVATYLTKNVSIDDHIFVCPKDVSVSGISPTDILLISSDMLIRFPLQIKTGSHLSTLDGLKGLALVMVIIYHVGGILHWTNDLHGDLGVDIFLFVTSFLLVWRSRELSTVDFLRRRFIRIFPTYWGALLLFILLRLFCFNGHYGFWDIFLHVLGLHGFGRAEYFLSINDSFWFVSILVLTYACFLVLRRWLSDAGLILAIGAVLTAGLMALFVATQSLAHGHLAARVPTVFLGFVAGALVTPGGCELKLDWKLAIMPLTLTMLFWKWGYLVYSPLPAFGVIALYASFHGIAAHFFLFRWVRAALIFLGIYSYEIYLLHQPLIREYTQVALHSWLKRVPSPHEQGIGMSVALALVIVASVLLHRGMKRFTAARKRPIVVGDTLASAG